MSAAFALEPSGPAAPCGFPKCTLEAFHDGDHLLAQKPDKRTDFPGPRYGKCIVCGAGFQFFADHAHPMPRICDSDDCFLELLRRESPKQQPILCPCGQRPYPHELSVHKLLRRESFNPKLRYLWPWSLCLSDRVEMSAEDF